MQDEQHGRGICQSPASGFESSFERMQDLSIRERKEANEKNRKAPVLCGTGAFLFQMKSGESHICPEGYCMAK